jgi:acetyltransferase-like isoleucine patch superfamily enzyme
MNYKEWAYKIKKNFIPSRISSADYVKYLERHDVKIGKGTFFFDPKSTTVDIQRPWMLHIGEYCKITQNVTILCHDYSRSVLRRVYGDVVGESKETWIGNNVFIGLNTVVCMGAHIGNNVIIGAGSVVTGNIPDNSVAAGSPARVICTLEEYYQNRKVKTLDEAKEYAKNFYKMKGRKPTESEMGGVLAAVHDT